MKRPTNERSPLRAALALRFSRASRAVLARHRRGELTDRGAADALGTIRRTLYAAAR